MARRLQLRAGVGERMLTAKLKILSGGSSRRTSLALTMLTGRDVESWSLLPDVEPLFSVDEARSFKPAVLFAVHRHGRQYEPHTVYLAQRHLRNVDHIIEVWQQADSKRLTRSAVLRRAIEFLRDAVEADPAKCTLESD